MRMQAAFQRHCDASISKTINFPKSASVEDVREIYDMAVDMGVKGVTVYRDGCRDMQPMALKGADRPTGGMATDAAGAGTARPTPAAEVLQGGAQLDPVRLPEIMPSLRIRQMTPFGNMHVKVSVDPTAGREREVFAQLGKGGDVANSDLEAICRILSLWLRSNGSLEKAVSQLSGIGSSLTVPTKDGRIMSLADGLATALLRYKRAKDEHGLEALLLGRVSAEELDGDPNQKRTHASPKVNDAERYKVKCPQCEGGVSFEEGCVMCHSCGFSQC
jgi:ribonucleoside-diphosphate reductase alpha chain